MFDSIISDSKWSESHGAEGNHLGMGIMYYAIPYVLKAQHCVCLGSGAGFVPKLMHRAQSQLIEEGIISSHKITLIDANIGPWGLPVYQEGIDGYPEITLIKSMTDDAVQLVNNIDYLHVDADHTYDQVLNDFNNYLSKMNGDNWAMTVHDTYNFSDADHPPIGSYQAAVDFSQANDLYFTNFRIGCGTGLIMPRRKFETLGIFNF
jgi:hypothetical protein